MHISRKKAREGAFYAVFESIVTKRGFDEILAAAAETENYECDEYSERLVRAVEQNEQAIDALIADKLSGWTLQRIPKTALAILRVSCAEILYFDDIPDNVSINEAVELAKSYCGEDDYQFVNGVLGSVVRALGK